MNYHSRMINIPTATGQPAAYKYGHRDARHAAAEIANEADREIEELQAQLKETGQECESAELKLETALALYKKEGEIRENTEGDLRLLRQELNRLRRAIGPQSCDVHASFSAGCLNCRLAQRDGEVATLREANTRMHEDIETFEGAVDRLRAALEEYAKEENWRLAGHVFNSRTGFVEQKSYRSELGPEIAQAALAPTEQPAGRLQTAAMEAETLLTNYLYYERFPAGSDCEQVRNMLRAALRPYIGGPVPNTAALAPKGEGEVKHG